MVWLWLAGAIAAEVTATVSLKFAEGFTRLSPTLLVIAGYVAAFYFLSQALSRGMPIGIAYGVWAATGVALLAIIGALFLNESLTWVQVAGVGMVIIGVLALELGGASSHAS